VPAQVNIRDWRTSERDRLSGRSSSFPPESGCSAVRFQTRFDVSLWSLFPEPDRGDGRLNVTGWVRHRPDVLSRSDGVRGEEASTVSSRQTRQVEYAAEPRNARFRKIRLRSLARAFPGK
jgi:hypothetical protein